MTNPMEHENLHTSELVRDPLRHKPLPECPKGDKFWANQNPKENIEFR